ncbi:hypothetical protein [Rhodococcus sp. NPDC127528]|uniref:hypothetical protein n=1 Tax=unclassified Rhodococcus (in: high G+C Gram-positive bacteria) TaxID=192944 RepID=UPI003625BD24
MPTRKDSWKDDTYGVGEAAILNEVPKLLQVEESPGLLWKTVTAGFLGAAHRPRPHLLPSTAGSSTNSTQTETRVLQRVIHTLTTHPEPQSSNNVEAIDDDNVLGPAY